MTRNDAEQTARSLDAMAPDHYPTCPNCGDLCGMLAVICVECGARLYEPGFAIMPPDPLESLPMQAAETFQGEDSHPATGTESC